MTHAFRRTGELKDIASYPRWLQRVVAETERDKLRVVEHELFALMRDAKLPLAAMQRFLKGVWPTIEQFPQFMSMNLKKVTHGVSAGEDLARRYLIHNIRVEQKHAEYWVEWARSADLSIAELHECDDVEGLTALAHWCWYVCDRASLATAIAATNYAVEGATGDWSCVVCSKSTYAESLPEHLRAPSMRWLRVHAEYDDTHPWEALDIVATLLGHQPARREIDRVRRAIRTSYAYMEMALDHAMTATLHGSFDETASNASTLGVEDLDAA
jgi:pyrroloquinoline quinone (PQQ) biosynthesis protein C